MTSGREAAAHAGPDDAVGSPSRRARFQPIVDLRTGRPIGWEARPHRWGDDAPDGGLAVLASLAAAGAPPDDGLVFVHVSAELIGDPRLFAECEKLGSRIVVDVRGAEVDRLVDLTSELDALATAGIHLSLENTSGVSLAMIARVRPTFVKLDPPLVRDIVHEQANRSVVRAYVAFAEHEGIHVIAEGVERHDQLDELRSLGVVLARGPLFGEPTGDWSPPSPRRRRPPLVLDTVREARDAIEAAADPMEVAEQLVRELGRLGDRAVVYFERGGVLRSVAEEGHAELLDGIPVRSGLVGQAFRSTGPVRGEDTHGGGERIAHVVRAGQRAVGVATMVTGDAFSSEHEAQLVELCGFAGARIEHLGAPRADTPMHLLATATQELALLNEAHQVEIAAARLADLVSGMSSALFALPGTTGLDIKSLQGPLAPELRQLSPDTLDRLLAHVGDASSCLVPGGREGIRPEFARMFEAGASALVALPVRSAERGVGLLLVADHAPTALSLDSREALELLARELGRTLDMVMLVDDLRTRATVDTLTGLGNLSAFQEDLSSMGARRRGGWALVMADVDGLKAINDTHGHLTGDFALRSLATALHDVLRSEDRMFRIGGDEFAALLQEVDAEGAAEIGRRMCEAAASVMADFGAGLSVGIAIPEQGETPTEFIDRADKMLYEVKRQERGTVRVAPPIDRSAE